MRCSTTTAHSALLRGKMTSFLTRCYFLSSALAWRSKVKTLKVSGLKDKVRAIVLPASWGQCRFSCLSLSCLILERQPGLMARLGARRLEINSLLCQWFAAWPWKSHFTYWYLCFPSATCLLCVCLPQMVSYFAQGPPLNRCLSSALHNRAQYNLRSLGTAIIQMFNINKLTLTYCSNSSIHLKSLFWKCK